MLEEWYQNWTHDPEKRKWTYYRIPLLISFFILIPLLAYQCLHLFQFFKEPVKDINTNVPAISLTDTSSSVNQSISNLNLRSIKQANLFGNYVSETTPIEEVVDAPETTLSLTLNGTLVSTIAEDSLAIITKDNSEEVYRVGDELRSNVKVDSIFSDRVIINNRGRKETLNLPKESAAGSTVNRQTSRRPSATANRISDQVREQIRSNPANLTDIVRLKKAKLSSGIEGFRIYAGKERQTFNQLGLKAGDFITAINGAPVADQNPFQVIQTLRNAPYINLSIERNGEPVEVSFDLAQTR